MNTATRIAKVLKASVALLVTVVGIIFGTDDNETEDRPLVDGSNLFGEYNFRTGEMDSGGDPDGWYEEDI
ncbi:MAG: hypothetical protein KUG81_01380 [Gammaproteobacteria bacterium]|nr:hypothetical protein [Gammaproteobacteria bacterium]